MPNLKSSTSLRLRRKISKGIQLKDIKMFTLKLFRRKLMKVQKDLQGLQILRGNTVLIFKISSLKRTFLRHQDRMNF